MSASQPQVAPSYGQCEILTPLIRRVLADNPGPFTHTGTGTFIVGRGEVAVIDPGPALDTHFDALKRALDGERISAILITHTHADHWPLAPRLAQASGAPIIGMVPCGEDAGVYGFDRPPQDGEAITGPGWTLRAMATPGHASNHVCWALDEERALFSGDHVMGWSTTVIVPPDGDMSDYLDSLDRVIAGEFEVLWPTHGPPVRNPARFVRGAKAHRMLREQRISALLSGEATRAADMVPSLYPGLDKRLHGAAAQTVTAHLIRLERLGLASRVGPLPTARWRAPV